MSRGLGGGGRSRESGLPGYRATGRTMGEFSLRSAHIPSGPVQWAETIVFMFTRSCLRAMSDGT